MASSCNFTAAHAVLIHNGLSVPVRDWRRHDVFVNAEVIVDDLVSHADDVGPWDLRVSVREFSGHLAPSFTDDLDEMRQARRRFSSASYALRERLRVLLIAFFAMSSMCPT
jgi:hypothetical protein